MYTFPTDTVTIIRKGGDGHHHETISNDLHLQGSKLSPEENRRNVIKRLREDPSVVLVLETQGGCCHETAETPSGFRVEAFVRDGVNAIAVCQVFFKGDKVYEDVFNQPENVEDEDEDEWDPLWSLATCVENILDCIDEGDYSFVDDDCPYFTKDEDPEELNLYDVSRLLEKHGYQTESLTTAGRLSSPVLVIDENDLFLLGSEHFQGDFLTLETKRIYSETADKDVEAAFEAIQRQVYDVKLIHWDDGSWSFRTSLGFGLSTNNFFGKFNEAISQLRKAVDLLEKSPEIKDELWRHPIRELRHYFIHEVLEQSTILEKLKY